MRVTQQTQPLPSSVVWSVRAADQRVVDADRAVFVDDDGGAAAFRRRQEMPQQRGLAGAEEAGEHGHRDTSPARVLLPPSERPASREGKSSSRITLRSAGPGSALTPDERRASRQRPQIELHQKSISRM